LSFRVVADFEGAADLAEDLAGAFFEADLAADLAAVFFFVTRKDRPDPELELSDISSSSSYFFSALQSGPALNAGPYSNMKNLGARAAH